MTNAAAPLRVVMLTTYQEPCGIATYSEDLVPALRAHGIDVTILSPHTRRGADGWGTQPRLWNRNRAFGFEAARVVDAIRRAGAQVVHAQFNPSLYSSRFVFALGRRLRRAGIPFVVTLHGRGGGSIGRRFKMARVLFGLRHAHVIVHTEAHARELARGRVHVIPHGVEPVRPIDQSTARNAIGLGSSTAKVLAHFGFLVPDKGVLEVVESIAHLRAQGRDVHYWISGAVNAEGESRQYFAALEARIGTLGLRDRVHLTGAFAPRERVHQELAASDWIVLAYRSGNNQSASGAVRRALASGRPVAVSTASVFDDVRDATHTMSGPLDAALVRLLDDATLADETATRGRRFCEAHSWPGVAAQHVALYSTIAIR